MSMFGEEKMYMEYLYYNLEEFFEEHNGSLSEFHKVLQKYFEELRYSDKKDIIKPFNKEEIW